LGGFGSIIARVFRADTEKERRPHTDEIAIVKILFLQAFYNPSGPQLFVVNGDYHLVRKYCVTTSSVHDSRVNLGEWDDLAAYRRDILEYLEGQKSNRYDNKEGIEEEKVK